MKTVAVDSEESELTTMRRDYEPSDSTWMENSFCKQAPDREIFFTQDWAPDSDEVKQAKSFCQLCAVRGICLVYGLRKENIDFHILGGATPQERRKIVKRHGKDNVNIDEMLGAIDEGYYRGKRPRNR